ncbi:MAG TPA: DMT family transporter [Hypericibacter adhaerens]|jgi:drug/metabolite transporter (DMT)-like permease|uniref:DMT family transporter n=1 Tax=Hypericibacter adhaerens TaxID=2602016 RepID=UPI002BC2CF2D|nr:DMT family transporter [Hypericibacter adhaerens]HWA45877.1 DMT family transporter [Hypericibacter adhaerens]
MNPAFLALLGGAVFSGLTPMVVRWVEIDPAAAGFWRVALMLPMLWLWGARDARTAAAPLSARNRWLLLIGGAAYGADIAVWFWSIELTTAANAQLFAYCYPLWVALAGTLFLNQRLARMGWAAIGLGLVGAAFVIAGSGAGPALQDGGKLLGDGFAILAGLLYTVTMLAQGHVRSRVGTRRVLLWTTIAASAVLLPAGFISGRAVLPSSLTQWGVMGLLGLMTFAAQALVVYALGRLPVNLAGVAGSLSVAVAATSGWILLGETLENGQIIGVAIVLAAVPMAERAVRRRKETPKRTVSFLPVAEARERAAKG